MPTPIQQAAGLGTSIWYDNLRRSMLTSGELQGMIEKDGLLGMTSNPSIFEKAIGSGSEYDESVRDIVAKAPDIDDIGIFEHLAIHDIQGACDLFRGVYDRTGGRDGFVSLEVSPRAAFDTDTTAKDAQRLWMAVGRPNVMIKIPGTKEGVPAIKASIARGININVTLLFAVDAYLAAADAYMSGLEELKAKGGDLSKVASVASFFLSRIDTAVDKQLDDVGKKQKGDADLVRGKAAIANAKMAYVEYQKMMQSPRWKALAEAGARPQRLLWASTGTKNPAYPKLMYVETLVGENTVNTVPTETYNELRDHGDGHIKGQTITEDVDGARWQLNKIAELGVSLTKVTDKLLEDGVKQFATAFDGLLAAVASKRGKVQKGAAKAEPAPAKGEAAPAKAAPAPAMEAPAAPITPPTGEQIQLDGLADAVAEGVRGWSDNVKKLWAKDPSAWTTHDEGQWLGWLDAVSAGKQKLGEYTALADAAKKDGLTDAIVLGMGGSSLCPWLLAQTFGPQKNGLTLHVLDSILPAQILDAEKQLDLKKTLFIVSSKSGSTVEPNVLMAYFYDKVKSAGVDKPGSRFVAITDPGSKLEAQARDLGFRAIVAGEPTIGGRYSALSPFGLVPAAVMGLDVKTLLDKADEMVQQCKQAPEKNPGVQLGVAMGVCAKKGRDKLTIVASPKLRALGAWLEQLIAESTGKRGTGIVPIDGEPLGAPEVYGNDRLFVHVQAKGEGDPQSQQLDALAKAAHPVVRLAPIDPIELGQAFFRWEIATAVAGSVLGINPFDQPDVEAAKVAMRRIIAAGSGAPTGRPIATESGISVYADTVNAGALTGGRPGTVPKVIAAHINRAGRGDYFAINAYIEMSGEHTRALESLRQLVRDRRGCATTLGYGPRFLHSTGQLHKGGPGSGVFLHLTAEPVAELPIPGESYNFATLERAQAQGDFEVLADRGRRLLRVHLGRDVEAGLEALRRYVEAALGVGA